MTRPAEKAPPALAWHAQSAAEAAQRLSTDLARGLDPAEAARRLESEGRNVLPSRPPRSSLRMFLDQFASVLVAALAVGAGLSVALGDVVDAVAIVAILLLNALLGWAQERGAANAIAALRRMVAPTARVRRGGVDSVVPAEQVVPGDVVVLEAGDRVPADVRLSRSDALRTVEAALTGESEPTDKDAGAVGSPTEAIHGRAGMAFQGTVVGAGGGEGVVVATAGTTELGRIADLVQAAPEEATPLQRRLAVLGRRLVVAAGAVVALVFAVGWLRGMPWHDMLLASIGLAVAAVPEGLPAVVTVALAVGVRKMARRNAIVRRLHAVEALGCTTVVCADKTGTLTVGRMTVEAVATAEGEAPLDGDAARETLRSAAACTSARLVRREDGSQDVAGDPTEGAILEAAAGAGVSVDDVDREEPVVATAPFDAERKRMSVVRRVGGGARSYVKGAPESVLERCTAVRAGDAARALSDADRAAIEGANEALASRGLRVLAVACRNLPGEGAGRDEGAGPGEGAAESALEFTGLIGMRDPPRPRAKEAVAACRRAGIRPVMITGDQAATALAVARDLGIANDESEVASGADVEGLSDEALAERVESVSVYARVAPEHKLRIVRAWRRRGAVVAMTGDGVNDAPALKGADVGVAMGRTGTDVAKDAAAIVVADDDFATIVDAVEQGRAVFDNVRKSLLYLLSGNVAEILLVAVAVLAGMPLPLLPLHLLWINLVTDGLPALALATDPPEKGLLDRRPRKPGAAIADRAFVVEMALNALLAAPVAFAAFLYGLHAVGSVEAARTYAFTTVVFEEVIRSLVVRSRTRVVKELGLRSNARLLAVVAATLGLQVAVLHVPAARAAFHATPLSWLETGALLVLALVPATVLEVRKLLRRRTRRPAS